MTVIHRTAPAQTLRTGVVVDGPETSLTVDDGALRLLLRWDPDHPVRLVSFDPSVVARAGAMTGRRRGMTTHGPVQALVELLAFGDGHEGASIRYAGTAVGSRLRYQAHRIETSPGAAQLIIDQMDERSGLYVRSTLEVLLGTGAVRSWTAVTNRGTERVVVQAVSSFASGALASRTDQESVGLADPLAGITLHTARSAWCLEGRWSARELAGREGLNRMDSERDGPNTRDRLSITSHTSWSSGEFVPVGVLVDDRRGVAWAWQVEHNGPWHVELDRRDSGGPEAALLLFGPTDIEHQWLSFLAPGESFVTIRTTIGAAQGRFEEAIGALTRARRVIRRPVLNEALPVIYNDFMNTLWGDPTTATSLPLIEAAATAGADYYVIDAGWHDDCNDYWSKVGEWRPSTTRFPGGLVELTDRIRQLGMVPGLWLEPEVIGEHSAIATTLPAGAFMQRHGVRVIQQNRYLLDLRHPAARRHLDDVVDRLVDEFGIGYFKLDYNITTGPGTDTVDASPGGGLLKHARALLEWWNGILDRHPGIILESCASGAMRADYASLSTAQLQSTSDQADFLQYAAIAAAAPAAILPEQCANWAYPHAGLTVEEFRFCMVNGLTARLYLAGRLDTMSAEQLSEYTAAVAAHRSLGPEISGGEPLWPLGLPKWDDDWIALGLGSSHGSEPGSVLLTLWRRTNAPEIGVPLARLAGNSVKVEAVYPISSDGWHYQWSEAGTLNVRTTLTGPTARVIRITPLLTHAPPAAIGNGVRIEADGRRLP